MCVRWESAVLMMCVPGVELWSPGSCPAESPHNHIFLTLKNPLPNAYFLSLCYFASLYFRKDLLFYLPCKKKLLKRVYLGQLHRAVDKDAYCQA